VLRLANKSPARILVLFAACPATAQTSRPFPETVTEPDEGVEDVPVLDVVASKGDDPSTPLYSPTFAEINAAALGAMLTVQLPELAVMQYQPDVRLAPLIPYEPA
jgi:hypothetical protein